MQNKPTPEEVKNARVAAGLTLKEAADIFGYQLNSWQMKERETGSLSSRAQAGRELKMKVLTFKNDTVSVGDIFVSSWGYEQTNVTFYQVLSVHGKKTVTVREIRANSEYTDSMVGFKTPVLNDFTGECFKRQIKDFGDELAIKIEDFETAYKTLPEEKHRFSSYY